MTDGQPITIDISVESGDWPDEESLRALVDRAVGAALDVAAIDASHAELSLLFTDDEAVRALNAQWRGKDRPTNVLSFPVQAVSPGDPAPPLLGDIVLARETVEREAALEGKPFDHHLTHLVVHGLLHLFGYDHQYERQARVMEGLEREILARLGMADPYA